VRPVLVLFVVASCWREVPPPDRPYVSFVARLSAIAELRRGTDALEARIATMTQRIAGLASEAEREALRADLVAFERDLIRLRHVAAAARARDEDPALLDAMQVKLDDAMVAAVALRGELRHARTIAEQEAFEELKKKVEGTHDPTGPRIRIYRRDPLLVPGKPDPILLP
jgi:hypothetical protein